MKQESFAFRRERFNSGAAGIAEQKLHPYLHHLLSAEIVDCYDETQLNLFRHLTIDQAVIRDPLSAAVEIERVLHSCLAAKKPVYIELPRDMIAQHCFLADEVVHRKRKHSDEGAMKRFLADLKKQLCLSKRPCIWLGHEVQHFGHIACVIEFAERHAIPIATSLLGKGAIGERHPLFIGVYQGEVSLPEVRSFVEESDLILILGVI